MTIKESDQVQDEDNWSKLPNLLLWMIKSRLDYPNGVRFSSVCKNWQDAYVSCPAHSSEVNDSPPWIMSCKEQKNKHTLFDSKREFVSLLINESYTIDNPNFIGSEVLYSRQGWLLMVKMKPHKPGTMNADVDSSFKSPFMLLNPFKNISIKLPFLDVKFCNGVFTIQDGNPHCIVLVNNDEPCEASPGIDLYIVHPGDNAWLHYRYTHICTIKEYLWGECRVRWTFIIGNLVYFITQKALVFVFNITDSQCRKLVTESKELHLDPWLLNEQYMIEREEGELLRIHFPEEMRKRKNYKDMRKAFCYKLRINGDSAQWELLQMDGRTCFWFLTLVFGQNFVFATNKEDELVRLQKAFGKRNKSNTMALCRDTNSVWVQMD